VPIRPSNPCTYPLCKNRAQRGSSYCTTHQKIVPPRDEHRPSASERGYDARWTAFRRGFIQRHPKCVVCGAVATIVDHKVPLRVRYSPLEDHYYDSLCFHCHRIKTEKDRRQYEGIGY
jgi:5-methylcytosine-specific restriction protein A